MDKKIKHPNLFVMIPREEREKVADYFNLDVVGEQYAKTLGDLTDELSYHVLDKDDIGQNAVITPILRAGLSMSNRLTKRLPMADTAQISMRRNLHTLKPFVAWDEFSKINVPEKKRLFITDPALATGGSFLNTIERASKHGFKTENMEIMAMFGNPETIEKLGKLCPEIKIYLAHLADGMRDDGYLLPYNGDTGDRLYGVRENEFVLE